MKKKIYFGIVFILLIGISFMFFKSREKEKEVPCDYAKNNCPSDYACSVLTTEHPSRCIKVPPAKDFLIRFPFSPDHPIKCQQGNRVWGRSHHHDNILFAVDLHSLPNASAGKIFAAADGVAHIFDDCPFRKSSHEARNDNPCPNGTGYGNHVRILHQNGYMTLYAHLSKVLVKHKAKVKAGDLIGVEGASGRAGVRHLHFGVHKLHSSDIDWILNQPGWTGQSVPFSMKIKYSDRDKPEIISSENIRWDDTFNPPYIYGVWDVSPVKSQQEITK